MRFLVLLFKNMRRNLVRSVLTALGTMVLVFVVTLVWSILSFLNDAMSEKNANFKIIVSERWQIPSQMPYSYAKTLEQGAAEKPTDIRPLDSMTWQFFGGSTDPKNRTIENSLFAFAMEPSKLLTMMDGLDNLQGQELADFTEVVKKLEANRRGLVVGVEVLKKFKKQIGDKLTLHGLNYPDLALELEIVGLFPLGRYDNSSSIHREYLMSAMEAKERETGKPYPIMNKTLNLVWLKVPDAKTFELLDQQIEKSSMYSSPQVKCETASSGVSTFLEAYRDMIWGMRWLLAPSILATLSLVIANSISISVRERRTEIAVLKVLGFRPFQILMLILGEALFLGTLAGLLSSGGTYLFVNQVLGGIKFPIAFFSAFMIPVDAWWWGPGLGALTAFLGSFVPAWNARGVKVSEVFSRIA